jgi:imidazoleglycerol phosphate synthase glutamine amidotransferase subunit HisH
VTASVDYGFPVTASVKKDNIEAFQFHPEKSAAPGLRILANFTGAGIQENSELEKGRTALC